MSEFKFLCPACSQRIQCDTSHAGRALDCPSCHSSLKVPKPQPGKDEEALPKAELLRKGKAVVKGVSDPAPKKSSAELRKSSSPFPPAPLKSPATPKKPEAASGSKQEAAAQPAATAISPPAKPPEKASAPKPLKTEASAAKKPPASADGYRVRCPVCDSKLHLMESTLEQARESFVEAKLVAKGTQTSEKASAPQKAPVAEKEPSSLVKTGRPGEVMKPRLSYILTGKPPKPKQ